MLFPFLKDIKYQILKHYWLVNLEVHPMGESKYFSNFRIRENKQLILGFSFLVLVLHPNFESNESKCF